MFYLAMFGLTGASLPYLSVWLSSRLMSAEQIGAILSGAMFARTLTSPLIGVWAEGFRCRRLAIARLALGAAAVYSLLPLANGFWAYFLITMIGGALFSAMFPLIELMTLNRAVDEKFTFGLPRGIGSAAFMMGNLVMGAILTVAKPSAVIVWMMVMAWATAILAWLLPTEPIIGPKTAYFARAKRAWTVMRNNRAVAVAVLAGALIQSAHGFNYSFSALVWRGQGIDAATIGLLWAAAILAEILFLFASDPIVRILGPRRLIILGGVGGVVRWLGLMLTPAAPIAAALQALHMVSFTATFLGVLHTIRTHTDAGNATVIQTLNSALSGGLALGLATIASGYLFAYMGATGYGAMAVISAAGVCCVMWFMPAQPQNERSGG